MSYSDKQVSLMEENRRLSDEVARLRGAMEQTLTALRYTRDNQPHWNEVVNPALMNAWDAIKAALTPQAGKGGGA